MKIGIIGSGAVGQTLANGFIKHGYEVMIGTEHKEKLDEWKTKTGYTGTIGSFDETADFGEIVVLSVKGTAAKEVVKKLKNRIEGKIVIDTTNPLADNPPENGVLKLFTSLDSSLMEELQKSVPNAYFVKAFNSVGNAHMVNPYFNCLIPTMFICGNDTKSKKIVSKILDKFGFEAEDMGMAEAARAIEPLCVLWCIPGFIRNEWGHAFKLIKK